MIAALSSGAHAFIDPNALRQNLAQVRRLAPASRVLAVVKADGYGHGLIDVARALGSADGFAVARLGEAARLREAGFEQTLVLLCGALRPDELARCRSQRIDVVVHSNEQLELIEQAPSGEPIGVWLKLDSGMHRLGLAPDELADAYRRLRAVAAVRAPLRILTHLSDADRPQLEVSAQQIALTKTACAGLDAELSIGNSAALIAFEAARTDWVRPGIMLYGVSPFHGQCGADHGLTPAMTLRTQLLSVRSLAAGEPIGYGGRYLTPEAMPVGAAAVGYADGFPRSAPNAACVLVNDTPVPIAGRVSMDTITLDLRSAADARAGDTVTLWGPRIPVERLAEACGTIGYELLVRVGSRVPRVLAD